MENKNKFIRSFATYGTFAVITGAIVLIETVPGFKADNSNQFYVDINVQKKSSDNKIDLELKKLNEFDNIEISTINGNIKLDTKDIDKITYLNDNEEIVISMIGSVKYYIGVFDYNKEHYVFEEHLCAYSKNEIHQYVLKRTK